MSYLLGITVGPVQEFIKNSRKLADLKASSWILSEISEKIITGILDIKNTEIIYPSFRENGNGTSNFIIFQIDDIMNPTDIINRAIEAVIKDTGEGRIFPFWYIEEIKDNSCGYSDAYKRLIDGIRDVKNTYQFTNSVQESGGMKCSICGEYNEVTRRSKDKKLLADGEELCRLCYKKREFGQGYKSTGTIAIESWKRQNDAELKDVNAVIQRFVRNNEDSYYNLDELNLVIDIFTRGKDRNRMKDIQRDFWDKDKIIEASIKIKDAIEKAMEKGLEKPVYEYAFIQFDIDSLGKWMSGKKRKDSSEINLKDYQRSLTEKIKQFTESIEKELKGKCEIIYSGGDDFLGAASLQEVIECNELIFKAFNETFKCDTEGKRLFKEISYSSCITIAPWKVPLGQVIQKSFKGIKEAKEKYEKNFSKWGVAINYMANGSKCISGITSHDFFMKTIEFLKECSSYEKNGINSATRKFENAMNNMKFEELTVQERAVLIEIMKTEYIRLLKRSVSNNDSDKMAEYLKLNVEYFEELVQANTIGVKEKRMVDFNNIISLLNIRDRILKLPVIREVR